MAKTGFCEQKWRFCNKLNSGKFSKSYKLTGIFRRGVTARARLKRIFTSGEYTLISGCL